MATLRTGYEVPKAHAANIHRTLRELHDKQPTSFAVLSRAVWALEYRILGEPRLVLNDSALVEIGETGKVVMHDEIRAILQAAIEGQGLGATLVPWDKLFK